MKITGKIERLAKGDRTQMDAYVSDSCPFIVSNGIGNWPGVSRWSPNYFRSRLGGLQVRYRVSSCNLHPDLTPDEKKHAPIESGTLEKYLDLIVGPDCEGAQSRYYMTGDGLTMSLFTGRNPNEGFRPILDDIQVPDLVPRGALVSAGIWLSARGTTTWLHYDSGGLHNLNAQVTGSKRILLFSPDQLSRMYMYSLSSKPAATNYSRVDATAPDFAAFPEFRQTEALEEELAPGDVLFLPAFWFHLFESRGSFNSNVNFWWPAERLQLSATSIRSVCLRGLVDALGEGNPVMFKRNLKELSDDLRSFLGEYERRLDHYGDVRCL